jgi:hypothetical protein
MGKYGSRFFTFLDYDGVPSNNNNAEHAIKGIARVRRFVDGRFTEDNQSEADGNNTNSSKQKEWLAKYAEPRNA